MSQSYRESAVADLRADVAETIHDFTYHLDEGRYDRVAALFAPDGVWVRGGSPCTGPDGVLAALAQRPAALRTRHLASNMVIKPAGEDACHARYYLTVYDDASGGTPAQIGLPHAIFVCEDDLARTAAGWRFVLREPRLAFKR